MPPESSSPRELLERYQPSAQRRDWLLDCVLLHLGHGQQRGGTDRYRARQAQFRVLGAIGLGMDLQHDSAGAGTGDAGFRATIPAQSRQSAQATTGSLKRPSRPSASP